MQLFIKMLRHIIGTSISLALLGFSTFSNADRFDDVTITSHSLGKGIYVLKGAGGNIGVSAGSDGLLIIDDQFKPLAKKIQKALADIQKGDVEFIVNTHWHGDHTGGNPIFAEKGATIVAHDNVRQRMLDNNKEGLPVLTFADGVTFHFNEETIFVKHFPNGHTDGDAVIFFQSANIVHLGDHFFNGRFPYIDIDSGGDVRGFINNIAELLTRVDDETIIIPGHGELAKKADLQAYYDMMVETTGYIKKGMEQKLSLKKLQERGLDEKWETWGSGFINQERWIEIVHRGMKK